MNTKQTLSSGSSSDTHLEQSTPEAESSGPSVEFFAVGIIINIVLVAAYLIWAYKQWNKSGSKRH